MATDKATKSKKRTRSDADAEDTTAKKTKVKSSKKDKKDKKDKASKKKDKDGKASKKAKLAVPSPGELRRSPRIAAMTGAPSLMSLSSLGPKAEADEVPAAAGAEDGVSFRKKHEMQISGWSEDARGEYVVPEPILDFNKAPFDKRLNAQLLKAGFTQPSPIQAQAWPICHAGRDIISVARTGSGKTLGFLLPVFARIQALEHKANLTPGGFQRPKRGPNGPKPSGGGVQALVLAPTRELAMQIEVVASTFGAAVGIRSVCVYGGASKWSQISEMQRKNPSLLIATPGRLNDLTDMGRVSLAKVAVLVLDEADRMLDMGFEPQLEELRAKMPYQLEGGSRPLPSSGDCDATARQTFMFSATWPKSVKHIASQFLVNLIQLNFGDST